MLKKAMNRPACSGAPGRKTRTAARTAEPPIGSCIRAACIALNLVGLLAGAAQAQVITEFSAGLSPGAYPLDITAGPDGNLWFTENNLDRIGRITPAGEITEFSNGITSPAELVGITAGPDGNLWFTEGVGNRIGQITPLGVVTEFGDGITPGAGLADIVTGPDGNLWFAEAGVDQIGQITPLGVVTEFGGGITSGALPGSITVGPDGNLWFTELVGNRIGRITPFGVVTEFSVGLTPGARPSSITAGPDGNLWFSEEVANQVGRITPQGVITEFANGISSGAYPDGITAGPDGNLWFAESGFSPGVGNRIARITPQGVVTEFSNGISSGADPVGIAAGPDGNIWFTEGPGDRVGRLSDFAPTAPCRSNAATLCIDDQPGDGRWQLTATYSTSEGGGLSGNGMAISLAGLGVSDAGLFWFFDGTNPEMLVKVLDGCAVNQHFWVFSSATTDVGFKVRVTDTSTGSSKVYSNRDGTAAAPVEDTTAFSCRRANLRPGVAIDTANRGIRAPEDGLPGTRLAPAAVEPTGGAGCVPSSTTLCVDGRFALTVSYHTSEGGGRAGSGEAIPLTSLGVSQGGLFWFFAPNNPEMLVKVLDGCALNDHYWVFYAAGTNVAFTLTITDRVTGRVRSYQNRDGVAAPPVQDTSALLCGG